MLFCTLNIINWYTEWSTIWFPQFCNPYFCLLHLAKQNQGVYFPFIGSFIEVDAEIGNEGDSPTKYDERLGEKTALSEMEDRQDVVTQDLQKESDGVQLTNSQNAEQENDGKDAADEWQDISLVTPCYLFRVGNELFCPQILFKENHWATLCCFIAFIYSF